MSIRIDCRDGANRDRGISTALSAARRGGVVVVPTESVYALVTDAFSTRGTRSLRTIKSLASSVPLSIFVPSASTVSGIATRIHSDAQKLMDALWPGELTLLLEPGPTLAWDHPQGAPLAVRMPLHPLTLALLQASGPLASTAATAQSDLSSSPQPVTDSAGLDLLEDSGIDVILDAGTLAYHSGDSEGQLTTSTVVDCTTIPPKVVRPGRFDQITLRQVVAGIA